MINTIKSYAVVIGVVLAILLNIYIGVQTYRFFTATRNALSDIANVLGVSGIVDQGPNGTININKVVRIKDIEAATLGL